MPVWLVDSPDDPRLVDYRNVPDGVLLRERGRFVAEGRLVVRTLLTQSVFTVDSVLVSETAFDGLRDLIDGRPELDVFVAPVAYLSATVGFHVHRGCLALGRRPRPRVLSELTEGEAGSRVIVAAERVGNADNIGALFRTARALGAAGVLLSPECCDPLYRKAVRVSIGASLVLPYVVSGDWEGDLEKLGNAGFARVALALRGDAVELAEYARACPSRVVWLVGHEGDGLTEATLARADQRVRIAMAPGTDSLNVATAAGIALYLCRQSQVARGLDVGAGAAILVGAQTAHVEGVPGDTG